MASGPFPHYNHRLFFCEQHSSLQRVDMTMKNDKAWIGDLLGGPLMSRESRIIAELMLTNPDEQTWQEQIVGHNILQASSANTAKRYATTIKLRLNTLDKAAWSLIAEGSERERQQLLFVALVLHSPVVKDFLAEVVNDLRRQFKEKLPMDSWDEFVASHLRQQPILTSYSDSSIKKMGNNLVKHWLRRVIWIRHADVISSQSFFYQKLRRPCSASGNRNWFLFWRGNGDRSRA
jgi:hypothetical protein